MGYNTLITEFREKVGIITLNRAEQLNALNYEMALELNKALKEMDNNKDIRVIVLQGEGRAFCAGNDLRELIDKESVEYLKLSAAMHQIYLTIAELNKPVIASVHKLAVANGVGIVASADLAIASEDARFGLTAVNVGLFCMGPAVPIIRSLGYKKALELLLTGDLIPAQEAERLGLVNKVVPKEKLFEETMALAQKLVNKSPQAVQLGKQSFYKMADLDYQKAVDLVNYDFAMLCSTEDGQEGIKAFLDKREANWKFDK